MVDCRYGKTRAAVRLEQIIDELDRPVARKHGAKVASIIRDSTMVLNELRRVKDNQIFEMMWKAWYAEMVKRINECILPTLIRNHLMCTVKAALRNARRDYLIAHPNTRKNMRLRLVADIQKHESLFEQLRNKEGF